MSVAARPEAVTVTDAESFAASDFLAEGACSDGSCDGAPECNGDGEPEGSCTEVEDLSELVRGAGNDRRVESEEQAAESPCGSCFHQV